MGKVTGWGITPEGGQREVYRPGETVSGTVTLTVEGEIKVNGVNIYCVGMALTKWTRPFQRWSEKDSMSSETYINSVIRSGAQILTPGSHSYKYSFQLPREGVPSSFEGSYGAIRYYLRVEVDKTFPGINDNFYKGFTVLAHVDVNEAVYKKGINASGQKELSKAFGLGDAGTLSLAASLDRNGYCPGEKISINLEAKNSSTTKDCGFVKATLVQHTDFTAGSETKSVDLPVITVLGDKLGKGQTYVWDKQLMAIDAVPPSIKKLTCHIIRVTYSVNVSVEVPLGLDLELHIPIKIGTVPLGMSISLQPKLTRPGYYEVERSKAITYVKCQRGVQMFSKSDGNFVNLQYVPMTAFKKSNSRQNASLSAAVPRQFSSSTEHAAGATPNPEVTPAPEKSESAFAPPKGIPNDNNGSKYSQENPPLGHVLPSAPPSYDEVVSRPATSEQAGYPPTPMPYFLPPEPGNGSVLVLLFPAADVDVVRNCMKRNMTNILLHGGLILAYNPLLPVLPAHQTSAIFIHFGSLRTGLSWLHNMKTSEPTITSRWWTMIGENKFMLGQPGQRTQFNALSVTLLKRNLEFKPTQDYSSEHQRLMKEVLSPTKAAFGGKTVLSSAGVTFASGDWSSLAVNSRQVTLVVIQWPTVEHNKGYKQAFVDDPNLRRFSELLKLSNTVLFTSGFEVNDVDSFQNV
ncbi:unnamed protein product [Lymnaea stagnalis]|uniref:Arrestin C-terminal-like domain-containing protein n=1 Tax=Lymnaea stagnalis TaxID=6523 RepID=A0AAV2IM33_LYMST